MEARRGGYIQSQTRSYAYMCAYTRLHYNLSDQDPNTIPETPNDSSDLGVSKECLCVSFSQAGEM